MIDIWRFIQFFLKLLIPTHSFIMCLLITPRHCNDCWGYATLQKEHSNPYIMRLPAYENN